MNAGRGRLDIRKDIGIWLDCEGPDFALEDRVVRGGIDLIDAPVVGLAQFQPNGRLITAGVLALADQHTERIGPVGAVDVSKRGAEVHVVLGRAVLCLPGQLRPPGDVHRTMGRAGITGSVRVVG